MKKSIMLMVAIILTSALSAQEKKDDQETFFGGKDVTFGGYGGPEIRVTQINKEPGLIVGGRGGVIISHVLSIGGAGYGLVTTHPIKNYFNSSSSDTTVYFRMGYGGLLVSCFFEPSRKIHVTTNLVIGAGGAAYTRSWGLMNNHSWGSGDFESTAFFIMEPTVGVEFNIFSFFRIEANAGYRYTYGIDLSRTKSSDVNGLSAGLTFKFGKF